MDLLISLLAGLILLLFAAGTMVAHVRGWRAARGEELPPREYGFRFRQYRRRLRTSGVLAAVAVLLPLGEWLLPRVHSRLFVLCYWGGVLGTLVWVALMAVVDMTATHFHFSRLRQQYRAEQGRLNLELERLRRAAGNGRPKGEDER